MKTIYANFQEKLEGMIDELELLARLHFLSVPAAARISHAIEHLQEVYDLAHMLAERDIAPGLKVSYPDAVSGDLSARVILTVESVDRETGMVKYRDGLCDTVEEVCKKLMEGEAQIVP